MRFFETFWAGCIPVVLSDAYDVPFGQLFDVSRFMIRWPDTEIGEELLRYLDSLPLDVIAAFPLARMQEFRAHEKYHSF